MANDKGLFEELFSDFFGTKKTTTKVVEKMVEEGQGSKLGQSYRCKTDESGMTLEVDLPGIPPESVKLWVEGPMVIVNAIKDGKTYSGKFTVGADYNTSSAAAKLSHGLLVVKVARAEKRDYKRIRIDIV